jgi:hypothetical protein
VVPSGDVVERSRSGEADETEYDDVDPSRFLRDVTEVLTGDNAAQAQRVVRDAVDEGLRALGKAKSGLSKATKKGLDSIKKGAKTGLDGIKEGAGAAAAKIKRAAGKAKDRLTSIFK